MKRGKIEKKKIGKGGMKMNVMALTAAELAKKIREREISVREAVEAAFENIEKRDTILHSYVTVDLSLIHI